QDPEWDPSLRAFYYLRVLENPTCRWSTLVCRDHGVDPLSSSCAEQAARAGAAWKDCCLVSSGDAFAQAVVRERAWSSPVWARPDGIASVEGSIDPGRGEVSLALAIGALPQALSPPTAPLRLRVHDRADLLVVEVPAEAWSEAAARDGGRAWRAEVDGVELSIERAADGTGSVRAEARRIGPRATDGVDHAVRVSLESGPWRSTHERRWHSEGGRLLPFDR
ncbi:MAG: DUF3604 domain-containing protein, partial [Alphaproteobacteria bacterium]